MTDKRKQRLFLAITLAFPLLFLLAVEGALRLFWQGGAYPLFVKAPLRGDYLIANPQVARRWFAFEARPPAPISEPFARLKPERAFRVFALGESSTAGFPYPRNVTFSRYVGDVLRDALPGDSVEVINLGIAATNSFAMLDIADEVIAQRPDAVLIYAGHNEWYGALGVGSTESLAANPAFVRATLRLQKWRIFMAIRRLIIWARTRGGRNAPPEGAVSLMETLARDKDMPLEGDAYRRGVAQFSGNMDALVGRFRRAGIAVYVGSLASNLRDQPPLRSANNRAADSAYALALQLHARGDTTGARREFLRARDLDVVRFRAPTAFDSVIRDVAARHGATYVPVAEAFAAASPGGLPGRDWFLEHVHPTDRGYALIGRTYAEAVRSATHQRSRDTSRTRSWADYDRGRALSGFDLQIGELQRRALVLRWPFVAADSQKDFRADYMPADLRDSAAFAVVRGAPWEVVKVQYAQELERRRQLDSAVAEYRGLARDAPMFETPHRLLGRSLVTAGRYAEAEAPLRRAMAILPTADAAHALARVVLRKRALAEGIQLLEFALRAEPNRADALYELALAKGLGNDVAGARAATLRLSQVAPNHPGLPDLVRALGGAAPTSPRRVP